MASLATLSPTRPACDFDPRKTPLVGLASVTLKPTEKCLYSRVQHGCCSGILLIPLRPTVAMFTERTAMLEHRGSLPPPADETISIIRKIGRGHACDADNLPQTVPTTLARSAGTATKPFYSDALSSARGRLPDVLRLSTLMQLRKHCSAPRPRELTGAAFSKLIKDDRHAARDHESRSGFCAELHFNTLAPCARRRTPPCLAFCDHIVCAKRRTVFIWRHESCL